MQVRKWRKWVAKNSIFKEKPDFKTCDFLNETRNLTFPPADYPTLNPKDQLEQKTCNRLLHYQRLLKRRKFIYNSSHENELDLNGFIIKLANKEKANWAITNVF